MVEAGKLKKYIKIFLIAGALLFLFQISAIPFIHNHNPDLVEHYDCPAYILHVNLVSFFVLIIVSLNLKTPFYIQLKRTTSRCVIPSVNLIGYLNKAPPL